MYDPKLSRTSIPLPMPATKTHTHTPTQLKLTKGYMLRPAGNNNTAHRFVSSKGLMFGFLFWPYAYTLFVGSCFFSSLILNVSFFFFPKGVVFSHINLFEYKIKKRLDDGNNETHINGTNPYGNNKKTGHKRRGEGEGERRRRGRGRGGRGRKK